MRPTQLIRPCPALGGFALFLAVNATSVWGGVFPFLPEEFQIPTVTVSFFAAQTIASALTYVVCVLCSYFCARLTNRVLPHLGTIPMLAGSCALIAAMYVRKYVLGLVLGSGVLLGVGSTGMMLVWQRVLAAQDSEHGTMLTIVGTGASALIYFVLCLCPLSVTAFLVPLVLLPLCGTALALSYRDARARQGLPEEDPTEQPQVYRGVVRDYWRSGMTVGSLGFVTGVIRAIAIENVDVGQVVNVTSMLGALVSSIVLVVLWQRFSFRFSTSRAMRVVFPVLVVALALLPFMSRTYLDVFAGFCYMLYAFAQMILVVQCLQAARDRGVDAAFVYGFCGGIAGVMQCLGLLAGWATGLAQEVGLQQVSVAALLCVCVLGLALYLICAGGSEAGGVRPRDEAEFLSLAPAGAGAGVRAGTRAGMRAGARAGVRARGEVPSPSWAGAGTGMRAEAHADEGRSGREWSPQVGSADRSEGAMPQPPEAQAIGRTPVRDRISKQCEAMRMHYRLSARETEVMEHIARGDTVPRIASELEVSENTVRTHAKRIYAKLDVHSKQELSDLIAQFKPAEV